MRENELDLVACSQPFHLVSARYRVRAGRKLRETSMRSVSVPREASCRLREMLWTISLALRVEGWCVSSSASEGDEPSFQTHLWRIRRLPARLQQLDRVERWALVERPTKSCNARVQNESTMSNWTHQFSGVSNDIIVSVLTEAGAFSSDNKVSEGARKRE